jgi:hypothetical protein
MYIAEPDGKVIGIYRAFAQQVPNSQRLEVSRLECYEDIL